MQNKRKYFRHSSRFFKEFKAVLILNESNSFTGQILNASDAGVLLCIKHGFLDFDTRLFLLQVFDDTDKLIYSAECEPVWQSDHPLKQNTILCAFKFSKEESLPLELFAQSVAENHSEPLAALG